MAPQIEAFFRRALKVICPKTLVEGNLTKRVQSNNVHVVGFGKGAAGMVRGVLNSTNIVSGMVSVPIGTYDTMKRNERLDLWPEHKNVEVFEVAKNNLPDKAAAQASLAILDYCSALNKGANLIMLPCTQNVSTC